MVRLFDLRIDSNEHKEGAAFLAVRAPGQGTSGSSSSHRHSPTISLNSVHINPARPWQLAAAGDDQHVLVYDVRRLKSSFSHATNPMAVPGGAFSSDSPPMPVAALCPLHMAGGRRGSSLHITCAVFSRCARYSTPGQAK